MHKNAKVIAVCALFTVAAFALIVANDTPADATPSTQDWLKDDAQSIVNSLVGGKSPLTVEKQGEDIIVKLDAQMLGSGDWSFQTSDSVFRMVCDKLTKYTVTVGDKIVVDGGEVRDMGIVNGYVKSVVLGLYQKFTENTGGVYSNCIDYYINGFSCQYTGAALFEGKIIFKVCNIDKSPLHSIAYKISNMAKFTIDKTDRSVKVDFTDSGFKFGNGSFSDVVSKLGAKDYASVFDATEMTYINKIIANSEKAIENVKGVKFEFSGKTIELKGISFTPDNSDNISAVLKGMSFDGDGLNTVFLNQKVKGDLTLTWWDKPTLSDVEIYLYQAQDNPPTPFDRTHTITWIIDGKTETTKVNENSMPSHAIPNKVGYTFDHWDPTVVKATGPATYTAVFVPNEYKITFNANGGYFASASKTMSMTAVYDSAYGKLPGAAKDGMAFDGWFTDIENGVRITADMVCKVEHDTTLYAHYVTPQATTPTADLVVKSDANGAYITIPVSGCANLGILQTSNVVFIGTKIDNPTQSVIPEGATVYNLQLIVDGQVKTQFASSVEVILPYNGRNAADCDVYFVSDDSRTVTDMNAVYSQTRGGLVFETSHFSSFVITDKRIEPIKLLSIRVLQMPDKTVYTVGEELDKTGLVIEASYSDGSVEIAEDYTLDKTKFNEPGTATVVVKLGDKTTTFDVTVNASSIDPLMIVLVVIVIVIVILAVILVARKSKNAN